MVQVQLRHSPYSTILPLDVRPDDSFYIGKALPAEGRDGRWRHCKCQTQPWFQMFVQVDELCWCLKSPAAVVNLTLGSCEPCEPTGDSSGDGTDLRPGDKDTERWWLNVVNDSVNCLIR